MTITRPAYCTREDVRIATDQVESVRYTPALDRAVTAASDAVEGLLRRTFYPWTGTRYFDWPNDTYAASYRLWLDDRELISVSALVSGGHTITGYFLRPDAGPPYSYIELDFSSTAAFSVATTSQRSIAITGTWGYRTETASAGTLMEALDSSETAVDVTNCFAVGVGDVITVDSERMLVTDKQMTNTGQTVGDVTGLAQSANATNVSVQDGSQFVAGEIILIDSERMLITDVAGNSLVVKRSVEGTALGVHTLADVIYAPRTLVVTRGATGTTAAAHNTSTAVTKTVYPALVRQLAVGEAVTYLQNENAGYARMTGLTDTTRVNQFGVGLDSVRQQAARMYGRRLRVRAI